MSSMRQFRWILSANPQELSRNPKSKAPRSTNYLDPTGLDVKLIRGIERPDRGETRLSVGTCIGSFSQGAVDIDLDRSPLEICGSDTHSRTLLGCLKVAKDCMNRPVREMSGGERTKIVLASLLASSANLLILDEPTNHLEIEAQEALEQALLVYP